MGPAEAPVPRLKAEYRYQLLIKSASRIALNALLQKVRAFAQERKWPATALVIDVDPLSLRRPVQRSTGLCPVQIRSRAAHRTRGGRMEKG